jgi:hypothetical protein
MVNSTQIIGHHVERNFYILFGIGVTPLLHSITAAEIQLSVIKAHPRELTETE